MRLTTLSYLKGTLYGVTAASIWAGWSGLTRLAVTTQLDAWDIAALRFGVAGILLLPVVVRQGLARDRLGWRGLAWLIVGAGVPYVLCAAGGLYFAPARDQGTLNPGVMPLFVALIAQIVLGEKPSPANLFGLALILFGAFVIVGWSAESFSPARLFGQVLFLIAAFLWACFTVAMRQSNIDPIQATALVATGSAILYLPTYIALHGLRFAHMPVEQFLFQAIFQGVLVTIASLILYGRAIATLGATSASAFGALTPALSALIAIPLLGEWPSVRDWFGIALISVGVYLAGGGPLPSWAVDRR